MFIIHSMSTPCSPNDPYVYIIDTMRGVGMSNENIPHVYIKSLPPNIAWHIQFILQFSQADEINQRFIEDTIRESQKSGS